MSGSGGAKYYGISEAEHQARRAQIGERQLADGIFLEVKKAFLDLKAAEQTLQVARNSVAQAEENFRIEQARFDKNTNTSTDVLDAQFSLTWAKLSYSTALYQWYAARATLGKATGEGNGADSGFSLGGSSFREQPQRLGSSTGDRKATLPSAGTSTTLSTEEAR